MTEVIVTRHACQRMKQRLGLPKSALQRTAQIARERGKRRRHFSGKVRRYLDWLYRKNVKRHKRVALRVHGEFVYIFYRATLITVYGVPRELKREL